MVKLKFTKDNEARRRSRDKIGPLPLPKIIPDKRRSPQKHKKKEDENG